MGWTNFIIVPELKLVIEISRHVSELHDYKAEALSILDIDEEIDDMLDMKVTDLTIDTLTILTEGYKNYTNLIGTSPDEMFLYWLNCKGLKYRIESEYNIDLDDYKDYTIKRIYD